MLTAIAGFQVLLVEIVAGRGMAPFFGNSVVTWTATITTVLAGLSIGYVLGGSLSKRGREGKDVLGVVALCFLLSAAWTIGLVYLGNDVMAFASGAVSFPLSVVVAASVLFIPVAIGLAAIGPLMIEILSVFDVHSGSVAGKIFCFSTLGSLLGGLFTGLVFIPRYELGAILASSALVSLVCALLVLLMNRKAVASLIVLFLIGSGSFLYPYLGEDEQGGNALFKKQNYYHQISVLEDDNARYLYLDRGVNSVLATTPPHESLLSYTKLIDVISQLFSQSSESHGLVIGGGAYAIPRRALEKVATANVTVVEIDEEVTRVAKEFFWLDDDDRLTSIHQDGRRFLRESKKTWDWIWFDAFSDATSIPEHLLTVEAFQLVLERLAEKGIFVVNTIMPLGESVMFDAMLATFQYVFSKGYIVSVIESWSKEYRNVLFVGSKNLNFEGSMVTRVLNGEGVVVQDLTSVSSSYQPITDQLGSLAVLALY